MCKSSWRRNSGVRVLRNLCFTMSDYVVPEEILIEILVKLPVKSLIRGTSVCKQWRSLIRSPSFISTHLSNAENQALLQHYDYHDRREFYTLIPKGGPFDIEFSLEYELPLKCPHGVFKIVGSCDGLVCLSDDDETLQPSSLRRIIIWNPAIRNHVVLPQPQLLNPNQSHLVVLGFGVANNVYKVMRLVYCRNPNGYVPPQAEIFCLGTGRWRKLTGFDDVRGIVPHHYPWCPYFYEGFVHWSAYGSVFDNIVYNSILRFHVGDEVFGEIMLPEELQWVTLGTWVSLSMMGESLGACKYVDPDMGIGNRRCDVWMMKDYGVKESWIKLYTVDFKCFESVIGFRGSDEAVLEVMEVHGCEVVSYNPETKGIKHVGIKGGYLQSFYVDDYKESLVLLGGYSGNSGEGLSRGATCSIES